ncbi:MAG: epoxide hydrolase [Robiginitomaculum sp.]|nr:MAG: epoxide hydrolase [Robiginitomaculum sp.]
MILSHGNLDFTAYTCGFQESPNGDFVLCLHGFPDSAQTFRFQLPALAKAGYRVLAPMMRGYELSSQPADQDYSIPALAGDVIAWIDYLGAQKVHLVGHDWGAAVTYLAGAMAPERFHSLSTFAIPPAARFADGIRAVPSQLLKSWYMMFFQLPGLAEWALERKDWALIRKLWRTWSPEYRLADDDWCILRAVFEKKGVKQAMLAYYRQNASPGVLLGLNSSEAANFTRIPVRTLGITGADDGCIDTRMFDHCFHEKDFPQGFRVERIAGVGHFAHLENPKAINQLLLDWFDEGS